MAALERLLKSSKAWVVLLAVVGVIVMNVTGRIDGARALEFIQWIVGIFLGTVAAEDVAAKLRSKKESDSGGNETGS